MARVILLIIDSLGIGAMKDVHINRVQDIGANTVKNIMRISNNLSIPNLCKLGLVNSLGEEIGKFKYSEDATYGIANLAYKGADSYLGHMEMFGYNLSKVKMNPISESIEEIAYALNDLGYKVNIKYKHNSNNKNGLYSCKVAEIDNRNKSEFCNSKKYIIVNDCVFIGDNIEAEPGTVYSVMGYNKKISFEEIKEIAYEVRKIVKIPRIVGVSSNLSMKELQNYIECDGTYIGINSERCNLYNRDYKVEHMPYKISDTGNICSDLKKNNIDTTLIGKVADIIPEEIFRKVNLLRNEEIFKALKDSINNMNSKFIAVNFQECDLSGHLNSVDSYVEKLNEIDGYIGWIINNIGYNDVLIVTADHGNDPTIGHRYHTREKVPILIYNLRKDGEFIGEFLSLEAVGKYITQKLFTK